MSYIVAVILFFFAAVGVDFIPHPTAWGLFFLAVGLATGGPRWGFWKKAG